MTRMRVHATTRAMKGRVILHDAADDTIVLDYEDEKTNTREHGQITSGWREWELDQAGADQNQY